MTKIVIKITTISNDPNF